MKVLLKDSGFDPVCTALGTSHLIVVVQYLPCTGKGQNGLSIPPRVSSSGDSPIDNFSSRFPTWPYRRLLCLLPSSHLRKKFVQCANCSFWVHLSCSGLSPADFRKIFSGHSWTCPFSQTSISSFQTLFLFSFSNARKTQKSSLSKTKPPNMSLPLITPPTFPTTPN